MLGTPCSLGGGLQKYHPLPVFFFSCIETLAVDLVRCVCRFVGQNINLCVVWVTNAAAAGETDTRSENSLEQVKDCFSFTRNTALMVLHY